MRYAALLVVLVGAILVSASASVRAHFLLIQPAPMMLQDRLGNPQKLAPCGGTSADPARGTSANSGTPTAAVTDITGGTTFRVLLVETVFHPGHYRLALARTAAQLPPDPVVLTRRGERGEESVAAAIQNPPLPPVIADGLFVHTAKSDGVFETDVQIPNIACRECVLQVVQFMAEHGRNRDGDFSYHHCAVVNISPDVSKPIDSRW